MQALFEVAREKQPSVIFFDEIDALMSARKVLRPFLLLVCCIDAMWEAVALNLGVTSVLLDHNTECWCGFSLYVPQENEHEASRRLKTEFMTQVDGATTSSTDRLLISKYRRLS
jgi:SpoVK/Ycf46/Vps4 family AAA+-type ATPase